MPYLGHVMIQHDKDMKSHIIVENQCSKAKITDIFLPVLQDAIATYQAVFGDSILNIRLLGSVARGEAGRYSDIDFIAVLRVRPTEEQMQKVEAGEGDLRHQSPFIPKLDLETIAADDLCDFRRFVFAIDSVSLFGSDIYTVQSQKVERQQLATMVTPDLTQILQSYRNAVESTDEDNEKLLLSYSRIIGKDILKCFRRIALLRGGQYERNIGKIYHQLLQYAPEQQELLHKLYDLYATPSYDKQRLLKVLDDAQTSVSKEL